MPLAADPARSRGVLSAARGWRRAASPAANRPGTAVIKKNNKIYCQHLNTQRLAFFQQKHLCIH